MSHWTKKFLDEETVVWNPPTRDGVGGYVWGVPFQVYSRWQFSSGNRAPTIVYSPQGTEILRIICVWLEQEVELGSYLWKGLLTDAPNPADAFQVRLLSKIRSIPTSNYLYKAYLNET